MRYAEEQRVRQVQALCDERGYAFKGFVGGYENAFSKLVLACTKHGEWRTTDLNKFVNCERGCPKCAGAYVHTKEERRERVVNKCATLGFTFIQYPLRPVLQVQRPDRRRKSWLFAASRTSGKQRVFRTNCC